MPSGVQSREERLGLSPPMGSMEHEVGWFQSLGLENLLAPQ